LSCTELSCTEASTIECDDESCSGLSIVDDVCVRVELLSMPVVLPVPWMSVMI